MDADAAAHDHASPADAPAQTQSPRDWRRTALCAVVAIAAIVVTSTLGSLATGPNIPGWYASIAKPWFTPPNWVFPVAWTTLFALMAWSFFRVLRLEAGTPGRARAVALFLVQLVFNAGWSFAFFAAQSPLAGLFVVAGLWLSIAAAMAAFARLDRFAALLLAPYLAWVSFAALLNATIWAMNR
jgi:benzodiazapine receptor